MLCTIWKDIVRVFIVLKTRIGGVSSIRTLTQDLGLLLSFPPSGLIFNIIHNYLEIMFPIDVLRVSEFRTMRNLSETLMLNNIQITSDYMSRWVVLKRRVGAVTSQRVIEVLFYVNILQCFFAVEHITANAVSVAIGDNGNRLIFEIWWNFFYDLFSIKTYIDVVS